MSNFLQALNNNYHDFTRSQKVIADYLSNNLSSIAFCTLEELADRIGVSTTTIIRFSRALGYTGYSEMQKDIQNGFQTKVSLPERLSLHKDYPSNTLLADSFQNDIQNIQSTLEAQNVEDLQKAIDLISTAPTVYVLGMRSSFSISYYTASRLSEIRENIHLIQSVGMLYPEEIVSAKPGDVCVAYLFPRYSKLSTTVLSWLKNEGVTIILFTSQNYSAVKGYGDVILPCSISSLSYKNSYAAPMSLSNYLIAAIAQKNYAESQRVLERTEAILNQGFYLGL
ncbi:MurR/RpiR family transcriptional regulator [Muricomes sp. OA1]|uniref:MurR/RpiR family transcriptional regulator n=1 Tax=Hungatella hathewayi TaxID=154046 RepID=A0A3E2X0P9_9FIRM|nr:MULTISPECIES: MurR/RpiR family transcriptional regulator [Clostridia]MCH1973226.1 MurR/RpiR family transcriptional regulator [Muricomes sp. OA1]MEE0201889.1 MurR/RpiR family transcriptional regulator [Muricomes sp.]RGC33738.1 MurR/RpiR family transcriptional regulator [Hungatella hathewayi]GKH32021.1 RpiR family transcriptional regulator [Faecalicatena contorta]